MSNHFIDAVQKRRSIYQIGSESPIDDNRIIEIIGQMVKHTPSSFNCQSARAVVLFGEHHKKLWDIVFKTLLPVLDAEKKSQTEQKIQGFAAGHGTVLYFEDFEAIQPLMVQFPLYQDKFPVWSQNANGMLQFAVWTALEENGLGASLQHYNPLIDDAVHAEWKLPSGWQLTGQMPFGAPAGKPGEKSFEPLEKRMLVFR